VPHVTITSHSGSGSLQKSYFLLLDHVKCILRFCWCACMQDSVSSKHYRLSSSY